MRTWKRADRDGVYYVQIPGQGGWVRSGQTSKPRAIAWALAKATGGATADVTLGVYAKEFFLAGSCPRIRLLEEAGERNVSKSWQNVRQVLDAFILPRWGKTMLVTIRPKAFFEWLASPELTTSKEFDGKVRPLSAGQRNRIHSAMNHIFAQAAFDGLLETNPLDQEARRRPGLVLCCRTGAALPCRRRRAGTDLGHAQVGGVLSGGLRLGPSAR